MHDPEHQDHSVFVNGVVHQAMIADTKTMKDVLRTADCLHRFAADTTLTGDVTG